MTQITPSTAITAPVAHRATIVAMLVVVPLALFAARPAAALLAIHGFARKIMGVMSVMMTPA